MTLVLMLNQEKYQAMWYSPFSLGCIMGCNQFKIMQEVYSDKKYNLS